MNANPRIPGRRRLITSRMSHNPARSNTPAGTAKHSLRVNECRVPSSRKLPTIRNEAPAFTYIDELITLIKSSVEAEFCEIIVTAHQENSWHDHYLYSRYVV